MQVEQDPTMRAQRLSIFSELFDTIIEKVPDVHPTHTADTLRSRTPAQGEHPLICIVHCRTISSGPCCNGSRTSTIRWPLSPLHALPRLHS